MSSQLMEKQHGVAILQKRCVDFGFGSEQNILKNTVLHAVIIMTELHLGDKLESCLQSLPY